MVRRYNLSHYLRFYIPYKYIVCVAFLTNSLFKLCGKDLRCVTDKGDYHPSLYARSSHFKNKGRKKHQLFLWEIAICYESSSRPLTTCNFSLRLFSINLCLCLQDFKSKPKCFATSLFQTNFPRRSRFCFPCFNISDVSRVLPGIVLTTAIISLITLIKSSLPGQVLSQARCRR